MALDLTESNFEAEVLKSDIPVLVDFWAPWCGPCNMVGPIVEEIAEEYQGKLKTAKLNVDEGRGIALQYGIMSIPTLMIFKDGKKVEEMVGAVPKEHIVEIIKPHI